MNPIHIKYSNLPVIIENGILSHSMSRLIMSYQEEYIMKKSAEVLCKEGGDILNVGYGLGIIDGFIKQHDITSHHIIEIHPQLYQNAIDSGYTDVHLGDWRTVVEDFVKNGQKFDSIYFDTYDFGNMDEWFDFTQQVDSILKPGGMFAYFNAADRPHVENYLLNELKYSKHIIILPLEDIQASLQQPWRKDLGATRDYKLIYFIK